MTHSGKPAWAGATLLSFLVLFVAGCALPAQAGEGGSTAATAVTDPATRLALYERHAAMKEETHFGTLDWQFIGPTNISGRATDVAVVTPKGKSYTVYVAAASGGVWKTVNEGTTWEPVFEHAASTSIGDIAIAPSDQEIVWIGTGEANIFRSSMAGAGVYKSVDGGKEWLHMGLAGTHTIPRIVIHPEDADTVYVASSGHEWTDNRERGVYKTTDGGKTWEKILFIDEKTGVIDLVIDPSESRTLYAATWQRIRRKWNDPRNEPDYAGSAIYRTDDGGATWKEITTGLPDAAVRGRIGIDIAQSNPSVLYAFIDNYEEAPKSEEEKTEEEEKDKEKEKEDDEEKDAYGRKKNKKIKGATVYRTDDRGETWQQVSKTDKRMERLSGTYGWVFGQIRVDPNDENRIYVMGLGLNLSEDGGKTFKSLRGMHGDHHGLWIDPENSSYLFNANDGGASLSFDGGKNWRNFTDNLPAVQFYNVAFDMDDPFHVYGSIQDHGSRKGEVDLSRGRDRIRAVEWEGAPGGEASSHAVDPTDPDIVYSEGFYGRISLSNLGMSRGGRKSIMPETGEDEEKPRGQWLAPFIISPHNPRILYHGLNRLYRSMNRGEAWEAISPDLTFNDKEKLGDIPYQTIFSISESPLCFGLIYVGTDDGRLHVTEDSGRNWTEIVEGLPPGKWVSRVIASRYDKGTVYLTQNGKREDDFAAYIWRSVDFGATWSDISGNIPCGPVNVICEDPLLKNVLYVGTDLGVYLTVNGGGDWHALPGKFPTTYVHDLAIHPRDNILVAATHGRGMYALDVELIQKLDEETLAKEVFFLRTRPGKVTTRGKRTRRQEARFDYYLDEAGKVSFLISDEAGEEIRTLEEEGHAGLNKFAWDLALGEDGESGEARETGAKTEGEEEQEKEQDKEKEYAKPGKYKIRLSANGKEVEGEFEIAG
jgi:photosystem II stability/assembly factor-like uncharacterized protein